MRSARVVLRLGAHLLGVILELVQFLATLEYHLVGAAYFVGGAHRPRVQFLHVAAGDVSGGGFVCLAAGFAN